MSPRTAEGGGAPAGRGAAPRRRLARAFTRVTGYELRRSGGAGRGGSSTQPAGAVARPRGASPASPRDAQAARAPDRLLVAPAFILSSVRSGSTLLRVLLDTHTQIHAPHELHLRGLNAQLANDYVTKAMRSLGADREELQFLLWDRVLHRELVRHDKHQLVNKTPSDVLMWERLLRCWPDARFIFLLRHPAAVVESWHRARPQWTRERIAEDVLRYMAAVEGARQRHGGLDVRYEQLAADPERETRRICAFLGLEWEESMLDYGQGEHGPYRAGLGDWGERIKSGKVLPANPPPEDAELPPDLERIAVEWGYPLPEVVR